MRQLRQTLRLHLESGLSLRECSRVLGIGKSTIADIVRKARAAGVNWSVAESLTDEQLEARLYQPAVPRAARHLEPDLAYIHQELKRPGVTLQLLWEEYHQQRGGLAAGGTGRSLHVAVLPARPGHPRDKPKVETGVLVIERWILTRLRNRRFFSLAELNAAIALLINDVNDRPFKKLPGCRREAFEALDRPALQPLPPTRMAIMRSVFRSSCCAPCKSASSSGLTRTTCCRWTAA